MTIGKIVALTGLAVAVLVAVFFLPARDWFSRFAAYVESLGAVGPIVMAAAYALCTVLFVPGSALTIASGALFGLSIGFVVVFVGANAGALCAFLLARTFLRDTVVRWAEANPKFGALDRAIGGQGFKMVVLLRLSPVFPFSLLNYLLALTAVPTRAYILANLLGMVPGALLYVYIGAAARDAIAGETADFYREVFKYVGLLATIAVVVIVTRVARKALSEAEQLEHSIAARERTDGRT
jgi:uncharacterized membrane protein YdjX (TVP38/TMEM64 family)